MGVSSTASLGCEVIGGALVCEVTGDALVRHIRLASMIPS